MHPLPLLFFLLPTPPFLLQLEVFGQEERDGGAVDAVFTVQRRHHQERPWGSHVTDRDCPSLRLSHLGKRRRPLPSCTGGLLVPVGRRSELGTQTSLPPPLGSGGSIAFNLHRPLAFS